MKSRPECIVRIIDQALKVAKNVSHDEWLQTRIVVEAMKLLAELDLKRPPAEIAFDVIKQATKTLGQQDCFSDDKALYTKQALSLEEKFREVIDKSDDPLMTAAVIAAAGGVVHLNSPEPISLEEAVVGALVSGFQVEDFDEFKKDLSGAKNILYLLGAAGEAVFDKLFINRLSDKNVTCVVRKNPVLLEATLEDAKEAGLDSAAKIIDPGEDILGTSPALVSTEFKESLSGADLIIAKGQSNFETLVDAGLPPTYFALTVQCECSARTTGADIGSLVFFRNQGE